MVRGWEKPLAETSGRSRDSQMQTLMLSGVQSQKQAHPCTESLWCQRVAPFNWVFSVPWKTSIPSLCHPGTSWSRDWTQVSHIAGRFFTIWATRETSHYDTSNTFSYRLALSPIRISASLEQSFIFFMSSLVSGTGQTFSKLVEWMNEWIHEIRVGCKL